MPGREHLEKLWTNILELGPRRLIALGLVGLTVFVTVGLGAYYLSRPLREPLYTGLSRDDVAGGQRQSRQLIGAEQRCGDDRPELTAAGGTGQLADVGLPGSQEMQPGDGNPQRQEGRATASGRICNPPKDQGKQGKPRSGGHRWPGALDGKIQTEHAHQHPERRRNRRTGVEG